MAFNLLNNRRLALLVWVKMNDKKRVLHVIQSLNNGGCENMLLRTLPLLEEFEHKIITLKESGELAQEFASAGIGVKTAYCNGIIDVVGILRLRKLVKEENPNIIITYLFHADMIGRLFLRRNNGVLVIPYLRTTYNDKKYLVARISEWLTRPLVSRYLANSEAVKNFYVNNIGVSAGKITVIPNGVDVALFDSIERDVLLRKSLNVTEDVFVLICVANFHKNKGHCYLLEAFEQVYAKFPNVTLLLVGDGEERENLEKQSSKYVSRTAVRFLGKRKDVPKLLKLSNVFVLPTFFEGMSNAILEAMAAGVIVITTMIKENCELIDNRHTGFLVPPRDSGAIAEAIVTIINDKPLINKIAISGRKSVLQKNSMPAIVKQINKYYKETQGLGN